MKGKIFQLEADDLTVISDDHEAEIVLRLSRVREFKMAESKTEPQYGRAVVAFVDKESFVGFAEVKGV